MPPPAETFTKTRKQKGPKTTPTPVLNNTHVEKSPEIVNDMPKMRISEEGSPRVFLGFTGVGRVVVVGGPLGRVSIFSEIKDYS